MKLQTLMAIFNSNEPRTVPLVIIAADKQTSQRTIKPNLKKPKVPYARQCSAPSSSSSSNVLISENSSRRDSLEISKKPREKSPCVSFDADVTISTIKNDDHDQETDFPVPVMRSRSRSDASSRFKGWIS